MAADIYYHFFDREMRESLGAKISDNLLLEVICSSIFMTDGFFYLPISNLYESSQEFPLSLELIRCMDKMGLIYPVSSHKSKESFILSRQEMYGHDKKRYPMYFDKGIDTWSPNLIVLQGSTTDILKNNFIENRINISCLSKRGRKHAEKFVLNEIEKAREKAVTYALFSPKRLTERLSSQEVKVIMQYIRKEISRYYIKRYLEAKNGTIITGIPGLTYYDGIVETSIVSNYMVYKTILTSCGCSYLSKKDRNFFLDIRNDPIGFPIIYSSILKLIKAVDKYIGENGIGKSKEIELLLRKGCVKDIINSTSDLFRNFKIYEGQLCKNMRGLEELLDIEKEKGIVLVAVTNVEMRAIKRAIERYFPQYFLEEHVGERLVYRELIGAKKPLYIVQSQMGIAGNGAIMNTMHTVCDVLNPEKVILGGIAYGSNEKKQQIGEILVSNQVWYYESAKVQDNNMIDRGDKISSSSYLQQVFRSSAIDYESIKVHFGVFASGEKLMDSEKAMKELLEREPELIGGDMEAAGLVSVCQNKKIDWIVVKAICDWGMNKEDKEQNLAADHSFDFIFYNLCKLI